MVHVVVGVAVIAIIGAVVVVIVVDILVVTPPRSFSSPDKQVVYFGLSVIKLSVYETKSGSTNGLPQRNFSADSLLDKRTSLKVTTGSTAARFRTIDLWFSL